MNFRRHSISTTYNYRAKIYNPWDFGGKNEDAAAAIEPIYDNIDVLSPSQNLLGLALRFGSAENLSELVEDDSKKHGRLARLADKFIGILKNLHILKMRSG